MEGFGRGFSIFHLAKKVGLTTFALGWISLFTTIGITVAIVTVTTYSNKGHIYQLAHNLYDQTSDFLHGGVDTFTNCMHSVDKEGFSKLTQCFK